MSNETDLALLKWLAAGVGSALTVLLGYKRFWHDQDRDRRGRQLESDEAEVQGRIATLRNAEQLQRDLLNTVGHFRKALDEQAREVAILREEVALLRQQLGDCTRARAEAEDALAQARKLLRQKGVRP